MIELSEIIIPILLSAALGAAIGLEREFRRKDAGLRTYTLVAVGSTLFTLISVHGFASFASSYNIDPSRVASQVVVGIGFIGAGLIFLQENRVRGLTTAAGLWVASALGMATALGLYAVSVFITILTLAVLVLLRFVEGFILGNDE